VYKCNTNTAGLFLEGVVGGTIDKELQCTGYRDIVKISFFSHERNRIKTYFPWFYVVFVRSVCSTVNEKLTNFLQLTYQ